MLWYDRTGIAQNNIVPVMIITTKPPVIHGPIRCFSCVIGTVVRVTPRSRRSHITASPRKTHSVSTCVDSTTGYMNTDSCRAMLPGVSASHWQNGKRDMGPAYYTGMRTALRLTALLLLGTCLSAQSQPVGTMSDLMVKIIYPASDAIFYIETRTPANESEWNDLQGKALAVAESANLLMMPGRARDQDRWMADAKLMLDAGRAAYRAARAKDVPALEAVNDALYNSCTSCHQ